jgi:hypothetical protein
MYLVNIHQNQVIPNHDHHAQKVQVVLSTLVAQLVLLQQVKIKSPRKFVSSETSFFTLDEDSDETVQSNNKRSDRSNRPPLPNNRQSNRSDRPPLPNNRQSNRSDRPSRSNNTRSENNRNNTAISYGTVGDFNSSTEFDPFAKTANTGDHYYAKRPGVNKYVGDFYCLKNKFIRFVLVILNQLRITEDFKHVQEMIIHLFRWLINNRVSFVIIFCLFIGFFM